MTWQIPKFDKLIATIRSREISACVILQTQSQLKNIYKDNAETIIGNMDTRLFLGGSEKTTLKDLSDALGKETIYLLNHGESRGQSPSYSRNEQKLGKDVLSCKGVESTTPKKLRQFSSLRHRLAIVETWRTILFEKGSQNTPLNLLYIEG